VSGIAVLPFKAQVSRARRRTWPTVLRFGPGDGRKSYVPSEMARARWTLERQDRESVHEDSHDDRRNAVQGYGGTHRRARRVPAYSRL